MAPVSPRFVIIVNTKKVVILGSGVAGLTAALAAAEAGAAVQVIEQADFFGGTTALSGGIAWMPNNHLMEVNGVQDSNDDALQYLREVVGGEANFQMLEVFVREARDSALWVEELTPLRWGPLPYPDYYPERSGGRLGYRSLEPLGWPVPKDVARLVRSAPNVALPVSYGELLAGMPSREELLRRSEEGILTMGRALIAGLFSAAVQRGVHFETGRRVTSLADLPESSSVVLATGGFERNSDLCVEHMGRGIPGVTGAPGLEGDGLVIAAQADADMRNMKEAWWCPSTAFPDELIDGQQMFRLLLTERARPGSLMVDGGGKRFINESLNYNDAGRALMRLPRLRSDGVVAWLIFDSNYRKRYHVGTIRRDSPDPEWLVAATSLEEMGTELDLPSGRLEETIEEFNRGVLRGIDTRFQRGRSAYDKFVGDSTSPHPSLGKIGTPPFYALPVIPGCLGTKGGPLTDQDGRVLSKGIPIPGLYAVGNTAANPLGTAYPGAGGTIGPHIVFGRRAGISAAMDGR